jgi:hypothetical protein
MKIAFFSLLICLAISSCTPFVFNKLQPVDGVEIKEFPNNLRGSWYCQNDSAGVLVCDSTKRLSIHSNYYILEDKKINLSDSVRLLKNENYYVLNTISAIYSNKEDTYYSIIILRDDTSSITLNTIMEPWNIKSAKKMKKSKSLIENNVANRDSLTTDFDVANLLKYDIRIADLQQIKYLKPVIKLVDNHTIIKGEDTDGWYSCGEVSKKEIRKRKRIKRIYSLLPYQK